MIDIGSSDLLTPTGVHRLMAYEGMTKEQAFDTLAAYLDQHPELHQLIRDCHASPESRKLLAFVRDYWDAEGLPVIWDVWLDVTPA